MRALRSLAPVLVAALLLGCGGVADDAAGDRDGPVVIGGDAAELPPDGADDDEVDTDALTQQRRDAQDRALEEQDRSTTRDVEAPISGADAGGADDLPPSDDANGLDATNETDDGPVCRPCDGDDPAGPDPADPDAAGPPEVPPLHPVVDPLDEIVILIDRAAGDPVRVDAKIAVAYAERQHGLMEVEHLPDGIGMLFLFEEERRGGFWMKNTLVPLDIAFNDEEGEILAILTMEPCAGDPCPSYNPQVSYLTALEVPAGWFEQQSVEVGDRVRWSDPVPADAG